MENKTYLVGKNELRTMMTLAPCLIRYLKPVKKGKIITLFLKNRIYIDAKFKMTRDGDYFFAENKKLGAIGTGETPWDAIVDLASHIVYFYDHYIRLKKRKLTEESKLLKKMYEELFK